MTDIVGQLRAAATTDAIVTINGSDLKQAANEIERLRSVVQALELEAAKRDPRQQSFTDIQDEAIT